MTTTTPQAAIEPGRFDIGRVGRETFGLIQSDLVGTYGLAAGLGLIPAILSMLLTMTGVMAAGTGGAASFGQIFGIWFLLTMIVAVVISVLIYGSLGWGAVEQLQGRKPTIGQKLSAAGSALLPMIGVGILAYFGIVIGTIFLIVPGLFLATVWVVSIVAAVVDRAGVFGSFSRSAALTKNHRWMVFLLILIFFVIAVVLGLLQMALLRGVAGAGVAGAAIVSGLFSIVIGGAINAIGAVGVGVVYQELRRAKGEFDPGRLAEVFS